MRQILIIALFLMSTAVLAQEGYKGEHFIEVTGTAEREIEPNEITLFITLREFEENRSKVQLEKLDQDFLGALKSAGIDRKRLLLADVGSKLSKFGRRDKDAFRQKSYELVLNSGAELEKFLEKIEPVKVDSVVIKRIHHSELEKHKLELKIKALQAAKAKAEALLKSIGSEIGVPLVVREWEHGPVYPMDMAANVMVRQEKAEFADGLAMEPATEFRKIRLRADVNAQFLIK